MIVRKVDAFFWGLTVFALALAIGTSCASAADETDEGWEERIDASILIIDQGSVEAQIQWYCSEFGPDKEIVANAKTINGQDIVLESCKQVIVPEAIKNAI